MCHLIKNSNINVVSIVQEDPCYSKIVYYEGSLWLLWNSNILRYNRGSLLTVLYYKKSMFWLSNLFWVSCSVYKISEVCCISFDLSHPNLPYASELSENWVSWDLAEIILPSAIILPWVKSLYYTVEKYLLYKISRKNEIWNLPFHKNQGFQKINDNELG